MQLYTQDFARDAEMAGIKDLFKKITKPIKKVVKPAIVGVATVYGGPAAGTAAAGVLTAIKNNKGKPAPIDTSELEYQGSNAPFQPVAPSAPSIFPGVGGPGGIPPQYLLIGGAALVAVLLLASKK